jgi:ferric-dicitrate binding protein FerR (iron transport regulator)
MNKIEFYNLVTRYLAGTASPEEEKLLLRYYDFLQQNQLSWDEDRMGNYGEVKKEVYRKALNEIAGHEKMSKHNKISYLFSNWRVTVAAASIIIILFSAVAWFQLKSPAEQVVKENDKPAPPVMRDIAPGGNKAILTLADGSQVVLEDANNGAITQQSNVTISKTKNGQLVYHADGTVQSAENKFPAFNTIKTPVGGQYRVVLSDGTKVWLNSGSSIKFPVTFIGNERSVEIEGEAYFEVAKDKKKPFKVLSDDQVVEVLGTHFNVNAYRDEPNIKTTLAEGSVKVFSDGVSNTIMPGQQARLSRKSHAMNIVAVDTEAAISWKDGLFVFNDEDIHSIMRKISRWYGVDVVFQNDINENFGGVISKFENVSQVLKILEVTETIHFKIEKRRITVMK